MNEEQQRKYNCNKCVSFRKTREEFGGLSNMAGGYPLCVNGVRIRSSEALYQACRFPYRPDVQELIIEQKSPMTAKMVSKPHREDTRSDWLKVRVSVMRWALRVKLAMHFEKFGGLLLATGERPIVEDSRRDDFWGAVKQEDGIFVGMNVLGRLLMELREQLKELESSTLRIVEPLSIPDFLLFGKPIRTVRSPLAHSKNRGGMVSTGRSLFDNTPSLSASPLHAPNGHSKGARQPGIAFTSDKLREKNEADMEYPKRLIEVDLPIRRISEESERDQNKRKAHLHGMHVWWATRPLAACRAVICAALWPDPADENCPSAFREEAYQAMADLREQVQKGKLSADQREAREPVSRISFPDDENDLTGLRGALLDFIAEFSGWDMAVNKFFLQTSRRITQAAHRSLNSAPGDKPLVVDPFAGAGSIPFEALRVGGEAFASDLNPVAVLLNRVALEYIPKYGERLSEVVPKWGNIVLERAREELEKFYPPEPDGSIPLTYLWARTIQCEGPGCGAEIPLMGTLWLARKKDPKKALDYEGDTESKDITFDIFEPASASDLPDTIVRGFKATCPVCGYTTPYKSVRSQLRDKDGGTHDARLIAVITLAEDGSRGYRLADEDDLAAVKRAEEEAKSFSEISASIDINLEESTPKSRGPGASRAFSLHKYGIESFSDLYTRRQALALGTFGRIISDIEDQVVAETDDPTLARAVATCLGLAVSNMSHYLSSVSIYSYDHMISAFIQGSGLAMRPDFAEANPLMPRLVGGFEYALKKVCEILDREGEVCMTGGTAQEQDATSLQLPDESAPAVVTDPPYYDQVPYASLSDFCYVWLKRILGREHPDLFGEELTPKAGECILDPGDPVEGSQDKDKKFFENTMEKALAECQRVLTPTGCAVVLFAHKTTEGWDAMLSALTRAGWTVTASWPIETERGARLRAKGSAALASSVFLVCRPRKRTAGRTEGEYVGDWRDVLQSLPQRIGEWLPRLSEEGIVGADAIFACLGPALEVFSQYDRVEKASGREVTLREYLEHVWSAVAREALDMVFEGGDVSGFEEDARLTAMWLWTFSTGTNGENGNGSKIAHGGGFGLEYDAARKIAQGLGAHLQELESVVEVSGDAARLLRVAERTKYLFGKGEPETPRGKRSRSSQQTNLFEELEEAEQESGGWGAEGVPGPGETTLDRVHQAMILFATNRTQAMRRFLVEEGAGRDQRFWRLAQALSALYPQNTDEKRWVDGVLARKKSLSL
ncbi:MAG: NADAR domain-containing protein [Candidatus Brocadiia bacterium]